MIRPLRPALALAAALALSACAVPHLSLPKLPKFEHHTAAPAADRPHRGILGFAPGSRAASAAPPSVALALKPGEWPQAHSDLAADPDTIFGALPNGMRYAIRRQQTPPGQAALRLRFDAGSLMETDPQQGLAHFLEHMAFNGSKAVPED
jgi:zinc protease